MTNGWIRIYRKIQNDPSYFAEPFTKLQAWIDLLLIANHDNNSFVVRGTRISLTRGQLGYSQETLAIRWRWSRGKVIRYLRDLELGDKIVLQKSNVTTVISISNYDQYQGCGTDDDNENEHETVETRDTNKKKRSKKKEYINTGDQVKNQKSRKKNAPGPPPPRNLVVPLGFDDRFQELWRSYREYRIAERKGWFKDERSEQTAVDNFWDICGGDHAAATEIIKKTIANRWTGLFPIKQQSNGKQSSNHSGPGLTGKTSNTLRGIKSVGEF